MRHLLVLPLVLVCACAPEPTGLEGIEVTSARLTDTSLATVAIIAGLVTGDATLVLDTADGGTQEVPVSLDGSTFGGILEVSVAIDFAIPIELDLSEVDGAVEGNDLLGVYTGTGAGAVVAMGVDGHDLTNDAGVHLDREFFSVGIAIFGGFESLRVSVADPSEADEG